MNKKRPLSPPQLIAAVFLLLIGIGAILLALPYAAADGHSIGLLDALFTATSALCVNGLIVVDTGTAFSTFGQIIIMLLIQIGGLGFMSFAIMVAIILGKKIGLKQRLILQQTTLSHSSQGMIKLVLFMISATLLLELIGAAILTLNWQQQMGWQQAAYYGMFHSVSAFNNAGFALWSDSLTAFVGDPVVNFTIIGLFVAGGLGYLVVIDILRKRQWSKLSLHTKIVLCSTGSLIVAGFLLILLFESWNPQTFGALSWSERLQAAFFQGTVPRSSGFNSLNIGDMLTASQFVIIILMFIGAASGGTGGGIKINTFVVLLLSTLNTFRGGGQIHAFQRQISQETVNRALAVVVSSLAFVFSVALLLLITEGLHEEHFLSVLFEATSAFSTTGLSMGLTGELSPPGKLIVIAAMFIGRLGPLTLAYALTQKKRNSKIGYAEDHVLIG